MFDINSMQMQFNNLYQPAMTSGDPELKMKIMQVQAALDSIRFNCCDACIEPTAQNAAQLLYEIEKKLKELY